MLRIKFFLRCMMCFICCLFVGSILPTMDISSEAQEMAALIEGAKKEGKVVYYTGFSLPDATLMAQEFEKKYPFLKVEILRLSDEKLLTKALTEVRAKSFKADIWTSGFYQFAALKDQGLIMKYMGPESKAYHVTKFIDPEGFWNGTYIQPRVITYNTKLISPQEVPKTYEDLLNPKFKGKIGMDNEEYQWYFYLIKDNG